MTRYERIKNMSIEAVAAWLIENDFDGIFCKSVCDKAADPDSTDCPHPLECCIKYLEEEVV